MSDEFSRRDLLTMGAAAACVGGMTPLLSAGYAQEPVSTGKVPAEGSLRKIADAKGLLCGTSVMANELSDPRLQKVLQADCNILVPEVELKWGVLQATAGGPLNFGPAEQIYRFATANNMKMRGHALCWWNSQPKWAEAFFADKSAGQMGDYVQNYIRQVTTHWRGRLAQWDVVNEPIGANDRILDKLLGPKLGDQYMDLAFETVAETDPGVLRVLNHDWIAQDFWYQQRQLDSTIKLVEKLMNRGAKIQCFGFEGHMMTQYGFNELRWRKFCDELVGMGLKLMVTELDVDDGGTIGDVAKRDDAVAAMAGNVLDIMLSYPQCLGVLTWGSVDRYNWLRKEPSRARKDGQPLRPTPRDEDYRPKKLWKAIADAINRAPPRG